MSESILRALIQLFALISDIQTDREISSRGRDVVRLFLSKHLNNEQVLKYMAMFDEYLRIYYPDVISKDSIKDRKRTSLTAMRILAICEKINEELQQKQKIYVLAQLMDFISFSAEITGKELEFLETVATAFNIHQTEYEDILGFILEPHQVSIREERLLIIDSRDVSGRQRIKHLHNENLKGRLIFLNVASTNTLLMKFDGREDLLLNGQNIFPGQTYVFDHGSSIRGASVNAIYYNDVAEVFTGAEFKLRVALDAQDISLRFRNSDNGVQNLTIHEESGKLVGIMGGSGVGKSTLLNLLSGIARPDTGSVLVNGYDIHSAEGKEHLKGVIGFVPQDDLLYEDLTVFQNLWYNARMCLNNHGEARILEEVESILRDLDLYEIRDLRVGSPVNKIISGGQRKRLNIALELIREPTILFVDEPTSGLSSVDAELVMTMLKEQTYKGRLVITTIHQPGSDIYKMFDRIMILDRGGYLIFYGNPNETVIWFKTRTNLANALEDQCITCGNVDTDQLLRIIESKVVNEHGKPTHLRRVSPAEWAESYRAEKGRKSVRGNFPREPLPANKYSIPGLAKQSAIFFVRDLLSRIADRQYMLVTLLGAPLLAILLAFFTRDVSGQDYSFRENENLPAYMFMCVITAFFMGLILSAEEIVKDRKILKRESFLNLSWFSYINSKVMMMFIVSALQTISFVIAGNLILGIKGMTLTYWIVLFSSSCLANLIGLNISSAFNSVATIYILIPFIIIPQLLFSGVLVKFDNLHRKEGTINEYVPVLGDLMPARWAYEALATEQYKNNRFEENFFRYDMEISQNNWYASFLTEALRRDLWECRNYIDSSHYRENVTDNFGKLTRYLQKLSAYAGFDPPPDELITSLNSDRFDPSVAEMTEHLLDSLADRFKAVRNINVSKKDSVTAALIAKIGRVAFLDLKEDYTNKRLREIVLDEYNTEKSIETRGKIIQKYEPAYMKPVSNYGRAHFYASYKKIGNMSIDTFRFNIIVLWLVSLALYLALYFKLFKKVTGSGFSFRVLRRRQVIRRQ
ncbi:MAG: ATP-binding cassette domain-containing protein [Bacteroidales bacterium]|nr:ATP-binding cassette domain-containing protein [Bacteroidales bacterium]MDT8373539.1 ATP-binding cassette domain-containing protein [Bacteroidales bacterium]